MNLQLVRWCCLSRLIRNTRYHFRTTVFTMVHPIASLLVLLNNHFPLARRKIPWSTMIDITAKHLRHSVVYPVSYTHLDVYKRQARTATV